MCNTTLKDVLIIHAVEWFHILWWTLDHLGFHNFQGMLVDSWKCSQCSLKGMQGKIFTWELQHIWRTALFQETPGQMLFCFPAPQWALWNIQVF